MLLEATREVVNKIPQMSLKKFNVRDEECPETKRMRAERE